MTLLYVTYRAQQLRLFQVALEVELEADVVVVCHDAHARGVLPDLEHGDHVLHEVQLAPEVGSPDAVGGVQEEGHVGWFVPTVLPRLWMEGEGDINTENWEKSLQRRNCEKLV